MSTATLVILVLAAVAVLGAAIAAVIYNRLITLRQRVLNAFAQIDVQLKRRHDLIPNLVEAVKGYMAHEKQTLERVIAARNAAAAAREHTDPRSAGAVASLAGLENALMAAMGQLMALKEAYPNLKADQNAGRLMEELASTENRVAFARQAYNDAVMLYNTGRMTVPNNLISGPFGFTEAALFQIDNASERELVQVKLSTMNFFEQQDRARKKTGRLVVLFCIAVLGILVAVNVAVCWVMNAGGVAQEADALQIHLIATAVTMMIIVAGAAYKSVALSGGGQSVARMLGGRPLDGTDEKEAMLQNVVEEMSIASGVPVPAVYVMDKEQGINAFAAGISPEDTVIGVTRGTLQTLTRDELQGVIGHEFSHILNGDCKLNLRLIAVLNGIMVISLIGLILLRGMQYVRFTSRRNDKAAGAILAAFGVGLFMYLLGSIGALFGRLIQSAVSRQREFLADASAVQFTRNPRGLAGALKKIGAQGSMMNSPHAMESAHLFFGNATRFSFTRLLATHPPLEERIKAIDPTWDGRFDLGEGTTQVLDQYPAGRQGEVLAGMLAGAAIRRPMNPDRVAEQAGQAQPQQLQFASDLLLAIPPALTQAAHDAFSARAVIFALLLQSDPEIRQKQFQVIEKNVELACYQQTLRLMEPIAQLPAGARLPLLELALPALDSLSPLQATAVRIVVRAMIEADQKVTLFEYTLSRLVEKRLPGMQLGSGQPVEFYNVSAIRREAAVLLSALAEASTTQTDQAFGAGARSLDPDNPPQRVEVTGLAAIDAALQKLARSSPAVKKRLIDAAAHTVATDGQVNVVESELLRATAATLDIPLPPLVTAPDVTTAGIGYET